VTPGGAFTFLYSFHSSFDPNDVGYRPMNGLIRSADGGLYGTTTMHLNGLPSIYRFDPATNTIGVVARLSALGTLAEARDGAIYGWMGNPDSLDPVRPLARLFRLAGGVVESVYDMIEADGLNPSPVVEGADGALYGTVTSGPWSNIAAESWSADTFAGGVFRISVPPAAAPSSKNRPGW
jgi:hypothetical protein